ncbi:unnamed protein product [Effrenium voratum]|uniref:Uncharacterized protein n=1 Tax=Effrenium voratum TaxID=2562239 RepID=A0AA36MJT9_9DINO|nr:unnamed protein product [Effrenium voratum]
MAQSGASAVPGEGSMAEQNGIDQQQVAQATVAASRTVTFELEEGQGSARSPRGAQSPSAPATRMSTRMSTSMSRVTRRLASSRSLWRYPSSHGQIPRYMQRAFRLKTFGLMTLQLAAVLGIVVLARWSKVPEHLAEAINMIWRQGIVYSIGVLNLLGIFLLNCFKDRFPLNYLFLGLTTVISGLFWSTMRWDTFQLVTVQIQVLAILCVTMLVATVVSFVLSGLERKIADNQILLLSLVPAWLFGCCTALLADLALGATPSQVLGSIGWSVVLLGILSLDVGNLLVRCDPDDFMRVLVAMNSTMLVVVSIPFFFLAFCVLRLDQAQEELEPAVTQSEEPAVIGAGV